MTKYGEDRGQFIIENQRLVDDIIHKRYMSIVRTKLAEYEDLVSIGTIGLIRAYDKFNPALNYKFSTYATFWIVNEISHFILHHNHYLYFPRHVKENWNKIFRLNCQDEPIPDIAKKVGISAKEVMNALEYAQIRVALSLESTTYEDDTELGDLVGGVSDDTSDMDINTYVATLPPRTQHIIKLRHQGFKNKEIGRIYGITGPAIQRVIYKLRLKLKNSQVMR
jgi:RNA polymerase sigma factor (sigma-70 family)